MNELHKNIRRRTKVRINFNSELSTQMVLDEIEYGHTLRIPADAVTLLTISEIVQTTARPLHLHEIDVMKRAERSLTE